MIDDDNRGAIRQIVATEAMARFRDGQPNGTPDRRAIRTPSILLWGTASPPRGSLSYEANGIAKFSTNRIADRLVAMW